MSERIVEMEIYGNIIKVNIADDMSEDYIYELANFVEKKMVEVGKFISNANAVKVALIALLNIADENIQLKKELAKYKMAIKDVERKISYIE